MNNVYVRIRRMGNQFMSTGIRITPLDQHKDIPNLKYLCPKLVPGQVVKVPTNHNCVNQPCIEIVNKLEHDEVLRPLVFKTIADAKRADPSNADKSIDKITSGMALIDSAHEHAKQQRQDIQALADAEQQLSEQSQDVIVPQPVVRPQPLTSDMTPKFEDFTVGSDAGNEEELYVPNPNNSVSRDIMEEAVPVVDAVEEAKEVEAKPKSKTSSSRRRRR